MKITIYIYIYIYFKIFYKNFKFILKIHFFKYTCIICTLDIGFPNNRFFIRLIEKY